MLQQDVTAERGPLTTSAPAQVLSWGRHHSCLQWSSEGPQETNTPNSSQRFCGQQEELSEQEEQRREQRLRNPYQQISGLIKITQWAELFIWVQYLGQIYFGSLIEKNVLLGLLMTIEYKLSTFYKSFEGQQICFSSSRECVVVQYMFLHQLEIKGMKKAPVKKISLNIKNKYCKHSPALQVAEMIDNYTMRVPMSLQAFSCFIK